MDPRLYNVASEELAAVRIEGQFWDQSDPTRHLKQDGERPLKLYSKWKTAEEYLFLVVGSGGAAL